MGEDSLYLVSIVPDKQPHVFTVLDEDVSMSVVRGRQYNKLGWLA